MFMRRIFSMMIMIAMLMLSLPFGALAKDVSTEKMTTSSSVEQANEKLTPLTKEKVSELQPEWVMPGKINADYVNLRSGPGTSYSSYGYQYYDDRVQIDSSQSTQYWWYVYSYRYSRYGYVHKDYVDFLSPGP